MAIQTVKGIVSTVSEKEWESPDGEAIMLYSFQIDGDRRWFRTGTDAPGVDEGDAIQFKLNTAGNKASNIKVIDASEVPEKKASRPPIRRGNARTTENWDARGKYWENKEARDIEVTEPRITFSAAQRDAIAFVDVLLKNNLFSVPTKKAAQLDAINMLLDEVTRRFYEQRMASPNFFTSEED